MEELSSMLSMGLSVFASASTGFLWLLQLQEKQPNLRAYWVGLDRFAGHQFPYDAGRDVQPLLLRLAVANLSLSPDALLDARVRVRSRDGAWVESRPYLNLAACPAEIANCVPDVTPLPINRPPKQTTMLSRFVQIAVPNHLAFADFARAPLRVQVELVSLTGKTFRSTLVEPEPLAAADDEVVARAA